ncbi:VOC family protein [Actinokineospora sp. NBRC 105648]|uniref:VOC family protein n=1 Tax=Actinokineospora sp. NBRC 105648 TaxID=3032206 RepID=UPI0024A1D4C3|nr:VOC family protein [Actinokineospora sp. NBRC 105648]GLZ38959.1 glyoxalase [Actinokineospora sp. NBRC 105648]
MVTRNTSWPVGTPCWVDLGTDVERATRFYSGLFGWRIEVGPPEFGGYANCFVGDAHVAGLGPLQEGQTSAWTTYLSTEDAGADAAKITAAGGQVLVEPMAVADLGTMAVAVDPTGGLFGLWQSGKHTGTNLANEPGSLTWNDQKSSDLAAAKQFYSSVFGYAYTDLGEEYATIHLAEGEPEVGGIGVEQGKPGYWTTYFRVADTDAAIEKVRDLGGSVVDGPYPTPYGKQALVTDDQGAQFVVIEPPAGA